ncbi:thiol-disulfide oxidoreductase DCC family protein [Undibacterium sp. Di26W]|uniref:thiol-disulfide oxidoreductase DCC family protein n=1 Tax=Undibacterium sp. Di26W TaxID=3413035 RepID=UPI003BF13102
MSEIKIKLLKTQKNIHMNDYPLTLLYDASCPLCNLEMANLRERDHLNRLIFIDASAPGFDASKYGLTLREIMRAIHGIRPDGSIVTGVETIHLAYKAAGLGWLTAAMNLPLLKPVCNWVYRHFASNRHHVSAILADAIIRIAAKRAEKRTRACKSGQCTFK